jgi:hypothetical protein
MRRVMILMAALLGLCPAFALAQEEPRRDTATLRGPDSGPRLDDRSPDLWYGVPGVRPGGDLLRPILDLLRKPSDLLDFTPRKVPSYLPDRETAEFLRDRR